MFTGLVTAIGTVQSVTPREGGIDLLLTAPWPDLGLGESVAVNGACLTIASLHDQAFLVQVVSTTVARTTLGDRRAGDRVHLERALSVGDRLGGHMVQGHIDGVGTIVSVGSRDDTTVLVIDVPPAVATVSILLGSITVDGVSLTINALPAPGRVEVALVPFTLRHTLLGERRVGDRVQLEGDVVGKYVRQFTAGVTRREHE